jgi:glycosyltransferase involved in cell wall biosynthesis
MDNENRGNSSLKILLLNYSDAGGGAAIASKRLLAGLCQHGIDAVLGVVEKRTVNPTVLLLKKKSFFERHKLCHSIRLIYNKSKSYFKQLFNFMFRTSNPILHSENKKTLIDIKYINNSDYDLLHFHWVNNDMISIEDISKIRKPIVWTMHDTWVFCGAEHYPNILENDNRFIHGYTRKNKPKTTQGPDICRKTWGRKKKSWKNCKFNFISPSNYEKDSIEKSALFHDMLNNCTVIPNIVPENTFRTFDKKILKELYQIPQEKKVIGFGTAYDITDKNSIKGGYFLVEAIKRIQDKTNYHLVVFGNADSSFVNKIEMPIFATGFISNSYILAGIYNLCDVFVCPSLLENLPNVCLESLFCGVPVTAFNTGGIPDIVEHKKTGYLAKCFDTEDLLKGILYCIDNYSKFSENSLKKANSEFDNGEIVKRHIALYESVLQREY